MLTSVLKSVDLSYALKPIIEHPIKSNSYPGLTLSFSHIKTEPAQCVQGENALDVEVEEQKTYAQEIHLASQIKDHEGATLWQSECTCTLIARQAHDGIIDSVTLILDHPENKTGLRGVYNVSSLSQEKINELIFNQVASEYLHISSKEKFPAMEELKNHVYNLGVCAELIKEKLYQGMSHDVLALPSTSEALKAPLRSIKKCIAKLEKDLPQSQTTALGPLKDFTTLLEKFLDNRPLSMFIKFTLDMDRALNKLLQFVESRESIMELNETSMSLRVTSDALCSYYRSDFLMNQFGSICQALHKEAQRPRPDYERILLLLRSPYLNEHLVSEFSFYGEPFLNEIILFVHTAQLLHEELTKTHDPESSLVSEQRRDALLGFANLAFAYNDWWKLHSLFDVVTEQEANDVTPHSLTITSDSCLLREVRLENRSIENLLSVMAQTTKHMQHRNSSLGHVPTFSVTRFSSTVNHMKCEEYNAEVFPTPSVLTPEELVDEISKIEAKNLYSPQKHSGLSHPTGTENLRALLDRHEASIYGVFNHKGELGGFFIILPYEEKLPEAYRDKMAKAKSIGLIPFDSMCLWGEVIVIDEDMRGSFKSMHRIGSEELFDAARRHEAGRITWMERGNDVSTHGDRPQYIVAMVGIDNQRAINRYQTNGWTLPKTPESIVRENDSDYYLMAKPYASARFKYSLS